MIHLTEKQAEAVFAFAECDMKGYPAARSIHKGYSTFYAILSEIKDTTGLNPLSFWDLVELAEAARGVIYGKA